MVKQLRINGIGTYRTPSISATSLLLFPFNPAFLGVLSSKIRLVKSTKLRSGGINRLPIRAL